MYKGNMNMINIIIILLLVGILAYLLINCPTKQDINSLKGILDEIKSNIKNSDQITTNGVEELKELIRK